MKCSNCGFENREDFVFCANCGAAKTIETEATNPLFNRALSIVNSKLFLTICILLTVASGLSLVKGSLQIIPLLLAIFMWIAYDNGKKNKVEINDFRKISGTVYANYVINNVVAIIFIVCGVIIGGLFGALSTLNLPELISEISPDFNNILELLPNLSFTAITIILGVVFVFAGAIILIINLLGMRKIHQFAKDFYTGLSTGQTNLSLVKSTKNWLIFFAITDGITALSTLSESIINGLVQGCLVAAIILTIKVIDKYILNSQNQ